MLSCRIDVTVVMLAINVNNTEKIAFDVRVDSKPCTINV